MACASCDHHSGGDCGGAFRRYDGAFSECRALGTSAIYIGAPASEDPRIRVGVPPWCMGKPREVAYGGWLAAWAHVAFHCVLPDGALHT